MMIASRTLKVRGASGDADIALRLHAPEQGPEGLWSCRYEIEWPGQTWQHAAQGLDSVQAVVLALHMIGSELYASGYHKSGELMFDAPGRGYGFPVPRSLRDLLIGGDAAFF
jgi:hypothetical protein